MSITLDAGLTGFSWPTPTSNRAEILESARTHFSSSNPTPHDTSRSDGFMASVKTAYSSEQSNPSFATTAKFYQLSSYLMISTWDPVSSYSALVAPPKTDQPMQLSAGIPTVTRPGKPCASCTNSSSHGGYLDTTSSSAETSLETSSADVSMPSITFTEFISTVTQTPVPSPPFISGDDIAPKLPGMLMGSSHTSTFPFSSIAPNPTVSTRPSGLTSVFTSETKYVQSTCLETPASKSGPSDASGFYSIPTPPSPLPSPEASSTRVTDKDSPFPGASMPTASETGVTKPAVAITVGTVLGVSVLGLLAAYFYMHWRKRGTPKDEENPNAIELRDQTAQSNTNPAAVETKQDSDGFSLRSLAPGYLSRLFGWAQSSQSLWIDLKGK